MKKKMRITASVIALALMVSSVLGLLPAEEAEAATNGLTSTLTAYYPFDGSLSNSVTGKSAKLHGGAGSTWDSAAKGSENYGTGVSGQAYSFSGNSGSTSGEGLVLDVKTTDSFTVSGWVNTSQKINFQSMYFIMASTDDYINVGTLFNDCWMAALTMIGGWDGGNVLWVDNYNYDIAIGEWTYLTLTVTSGGTVSFYDNGRLVNSLTYPSGVYKNQFSGQDIYLGINCWDASFSGLMDEVTVYSSALSASDVALLYANNGNPYGDVTDASTLDVSTAHHVSVHDPSIVKGYVAGDVTKLTANTSMVGVKDDDHTKEVYFIFGSHLAWAYSWDLVTWTTFENNINSDYRTLFAEEAKWSAKGGDGYDVSGNMWAPDVIWNPNYKNDDGTTGAWCMYMSINGDSHYSTICLLTSDSLYGSWTHRGMVTQSGICWGTLSFDYTKVTGESTVASRYKEYRNSTNNRVYGVNAIDPCVILDDDGSLWMSYGSWFGGIWMLRLDSSTGLRDYSTAYDLDIKNAVYSADNNGHQYLSGGYVTSDPYQGIKIAGGYHSSGEASYIQKIGNYYYLFVTYGSLEATGGYNMRVFRSDSITGPYVDESGDAANYSSYVNNTGNCSIGMRLMSYYKWSYQKWGQVAQGHNSVLLDDDGSIYLVYHTRTNDGTEGHSIRVHQMFLNEDGWLVAAPFEYSSYDSVSESGYDASEIAGDYEVMLQVSTNDYSNLELVKNYDISLNADGSVSGGLKGTWSLASGSPYINITLTGTGADTYKGIVMTQQIEDGDGIACTFTAVGKNTEVALWGYSKNASVIESQGGTDEDTGEDADEDTYQVSDGGGVATYQVSGSGKATFMGTTATGDVVIPDEVTLGGVTYKVTAIADKAFAGDTKLTSITLGKNIKTIGKAAFKGCTALSKVTLKKKVKKIKANAFKNCTGLKTVKVKGEKLTKIGNGAFSGINKNAKVMVPAAQYATYKALFGAGFTVVSY